MSCKSLRCNDIINKNLRLVLACKCAILANFNKRSKLVSRFWSWRDLENMGWSNEGNHSRDYSVRWKKYPCLQGCRGVIVRFSTSGTKPKNRSMKLGLADIFLLCTWPGWCWKQAFNKIIKALMELYNSTEEAWKCASLLGDCHYEGISDFLSQATKSDRRAKDADFINRVITDSLSD